jgi:hypothetical protein
MRQIGDTLVWLAMITVVAAVVYFTPRLASYVTSVSSDHGRDCVTCQELVYHQSDQTAQTP